MTTGIGDLAVSNDNIYALEVLNKKVNVISLADATNTLSITSDKRIYDIAVSHNKLFLGGSFSSLTIDAGEAISINNFAAIDSNDHTLLPWETSPNSIVQSFATTGDLLFVAGNFGQLTENENTSARYIASFDLTTNALIDWAPQGKCTSKNQIYAFNGAVYTTCYLGLEKYDILDDSRTELINMPLSASLAFSQNQIYISGRTKSIAESAVRNRFAAVSKNGVLLDWAPAFNSNINTLLLSGNTLYLSGNFKTIDDQAREHAAAFDVRDESLLDWAPENAPLFTTSLMHLGNTIYAGGRSWLGAFDDATGEAATVNWAPSIEGNVADIVTDGTTIYVSGSFTEINDSAQPYLAGLDLNGNTIWSPSVDRNIYDLNMMASTLYVSGQFTSFEESSRKGLALIDTSSSMNLMPWEATTTYGREIVMDNNTLYSFGSSSIYAINRSDGTLLWTVPVQTFGGSQKLALVDDVLMINANTITTSSQTSINSSGFARIRAADGAVLD